MVYDVTSDGRPENARVFYDTTSVQTAGSPDGLKVDEGGNLWATGPGGVWIFSPDGRHLGTIQPPEVPANVAFGDPDARTLYMTARTSVYRIRVNVRGARNRR